jgi:hypothetical protein
MKQIWLAFLSNHDTPSATNATSELSVKALTVRMREKNQSPFKT